MGRACVEKYNLQEGKPCCMTCHTAVVNDRRALCFDKKTCEVDALGKVEGLTLHMQRRSADKKDFDISRLQKELEEEKDEKRKMARENLELASQLKGVPCGLSQLPGMRAPTRSRVNYRRSRRCGLSLSRHVPFLHCPMISATL